MDLLKGMIANRHAAGIVLADPKPRKETGRKKKTKNEKAKEHVPGSRDMRNFIIEEKPSTKIVREHLQAICDIECETSSEDE